MYTRSKQTWSVEPSCQADCLPFGGCLWILRSVSHQPRASLSWGPDHVHVSLPPPACHCWSAAVVTRRHVDLDFQTGNKRSMSEACCVKYLLSHNHSSAFSAVKAASATAGCGHPSHGRSRTLSAWTFLTHLNWSVNTVSSKALVTSHSNQRQGLILSSLLLQIHTKQTHTKNFKEKKLTKTTVTAIKVLFSLPGFLHV